MIRIRAPCAPGRTVRHRFATSCNGAENFAAKWDHEWDHEAPEQRGRLLFYRRKEPLNPHAPKADALPDCAMPRLCGRIPSHPR